MKRPEKDCARDQGLATEGLATGVALRPGGARRELSQNLERVAKGSEDHSQPAVRGQGRNTQALTAPCPLSCPFLPGAKALEARGQGEVPRAGAEGAGRGRAAISLPWHLPGARPFQLHPSSFLLVQVLRVLPQSPPLKVTSWPREPQGSRSEETIGAFFSTASPSRPQGQCENPHPVPSSSAHEEAEPGEGPESSDTGRFRILVTPPSNASRQFSSRKPQLSTMRGFQSTRQGDFHLRVTYLKQGPS